MSCPLNQKIINLDFGYRWLPTVVSSEKDLDQVLSEDYWDNHPVMKQRLSFGGNSYLCCFCNPYSGINRTHIMLFIVGDRGLRLLTHSVAENVNLYNIQAQIDADGKILFVDRNDEKMVFAAVLLER